MKFIFLIKCTALFLFCVTILAICGCGEQTESAFSDKIILSYNPEITKPESVWPDKKLEERFREYWYRRFAGDIDGVWKLEAPHFQFMAQRHLYDNYLSSSGVQFPLLVHVFEITSLGNHVYNVRVRMDLTRAGQERSVSMNDRWVKVQGDWYHVIRDPLVFPFSM